MCLVLILLGLLTELPQAIEVRVNGPGVKAKWVRIELRKVETLPTGGPTNTFFDHVGSGPIVLWQSSEEYAALTTVSSTSPVFIQNHLPDLPPRFLARFPFQYPNTRIYPTQYCSRESGCVILLSLSLSL